MLRGAQTRSMTRVGWRRFVLTGGPANPAANAWPKHLPYFDGASLDYLASGRCPRKAPRRENTAPDALPDRGLTKVLARHK